MRKRSLGTRSIEVPEITLGTWGLCTTAYGALPDSADGKGTDEIVEEVIKKAIDLGITSFDMAPLWGNGFSEEAVARAVGDRRNECTFITRGGAAWKDGRAVTRFEPYDLISDCEASLKRLGTDYLDLWMLHNPPEYVLSRDDWSRTASRLKEDGKIKAWGVSVGDAAQARQAITAGADVICLVYNLLNADDLHGLANEVQSAGCGVLARSTLAYGLLSGTWNSGKSFPEKDHRSQRWSPHALQTRIKQTSTLGFLSGGDIPSLASASIRYVLSNKLVSSAIVGARSITQLEEAAKCADQDPYLSEELKGRIPGALASATR